jgi:hypothetical protein
MQSSNRIEVTYHKTAEKEMQDASRRGSGVAPQLQKISQDWGVEGVDQEYFSILII